MIAQLAIERPAGGCHVCRRCGSDVEPADWWTRPGLYLRPPACDADALDTRGMSSEDNRTTDIALTCAVAHSNGRTCDLRLHTMRTRRILNALRLKKILSSPSLPRSFCPITFNYRTNEHSCRIERALNSSRQFSSLYRWSRRPSRRRHADTFVHNA